MANEKKDDANIRHLYISHNVPYLLLQIEHNGYAKFKGVGGGGQIRCIMWDLQLANPAILTEQAWSIKDLFYGQIIVLLIHSGLSCCYLVSYK